jgi:excinuclease ABC subunit B
MSGFRLCAPYDPAGDQPAAIEALVAGLAAGRREQVLLGVTGSGKTFTIANVIARLNRPTLVISHNKTLAAQLYAEFKEFFPDNAVEYFVSYYDYYQPEAYLPASDTYIEKDASINEHLDRLRLRATARLLSRRDVIVVASVSCIYNIGTPEDFKALCVHLRCGARMPLQELTAELVRIRYERNDIGFQRNRFRVRGGVLDIWPSYAETFLRVRVEDDVIESIGEHRPPAGERITAHEEFFLYPASHFVTAQPRFEAALAAIEAEMRERAAWFAAQGKPLEAERIVQRTMNDLELMRVAGFCHGIENYSRHLSGRAPGERPQCLIDYFPRDFLCVIDESHATIPQIRGMYEGDRSRKQSLIDFGFRLPSAVDNRPLTFSEVQGLLGDVIYVSATPAPWELERAGGVVVEQVIRPTGLVDPAAEVRPSSNQVPDVEREIAGVVSAGGRVLVNTLTKRTAEDLASWLQERGMRVRYIHSSIDALERIEILRTLRAGLVDVLVGVNLLREGLDLPEVVLVAILDADKEGFLRNETTLVQLAGRAARHVEGRIILYADTVTRSMENALREMRRRRERQLAHNREHGITPRGIVKAVRELAEFQYGARVRHAPDARQFSADALDPAAAASAARALETALREAVELLDFESAIIYRDTLRELREHLSGGTSGNAVPPARQTRRTRRA